MTVYRSLGDTNVATLSDSSRNRRFHFDGCFAHRYRLASGRAVKSTIPSASPWAKAMHSRDRRVPAPIVAIRCLTAYVDVSRTRASSHPAVFGWDMVVFFDRYEPDARADARRRIKRSRQVDCSGPLASTDPVGAPVGDPPGGSSDTASTPCAFIRARISGGSMIVAG